MTLGEKIKFLYHELGYDIDAISKHFDIAEKECIKRLYPFYDPNTVACHTIAGGIPKNIEGLYNHYNNVVSKVESLSRKVNLLTGSATPRLIIGRKEPWKFEKYIKSPEWLKEITSENVSDVTKANKIIERLTTEPVEEVLGRWKRKYYPHGSSSSAHGKFVKMVSDMYENGLAKYLEYVYSCGRNPNDVVPYHSYIHDVPFYRFHLNDGSHVPSYGDVVATCYCIIQDADPLNALTVNDVINKINAVSIRGEEKHVTFLKLNGIYLPKVCSKEIRYLYLVEGYSLRAISKFYNFNIIEVRNVLFDIPVITNKYSDPIDMKQDEVFTKVLNSGTGNTVYTY